MKKKIVFAGLGAAGLSAFAEGTSASIADLGVNLSDYMDAFSTALGTPLGKAISVSFAILALVVGYKLFKKFILRA